ncbi:MAG: hypothetical protein J7449_11575, partial [Thermomicrobium sp.]|uniref:hypothetical protein n=1 Tax=Thermomicrobium sp. TaxID=1969469 RepID=UPI001B1C8088
PHAPRVTRTGVAAPKIPHRPNLFLPPEGIERTAGSSHDTPSAAFSPCLAREETVPLLLGRLGDKLQTHRQFGDLLAEAFDRLEVRKLAERSSSTT